jgi:leader peptidase (prepilin peptidase)/N-methyltransferase
MSGSYETPQDAGKTAGQVELAPAHEDLSATWPVTWLWAGFSAIYVALAIALLKLPTLTWLVTAEALVLGVLLVALSVIDARTFRLPNSLNLALGAAGLGFAALHGTAALTNSALSALAGGAALWLLAFAYIRLRGRDGLGMGDVKLTAAGAAWVGILGVPSALFFASLSAVLVFAAAMLGGRRVSGASAMPFGPFIALGFWIVWLSGPL